MSFRIRRLEEHREPRFLRLKRFAALLFLTLQPLFALGRKLRDKREHERRMQRVVALCVAFTVAASILLLTLSLLLRAGSLSLSSLLERTGVPLASDASGITNILLLGQGDETHEGIDLTDSIMVASLDASTSLSMTRGDTSSIVLLSLPRDLYFLHTEFLQLGKGKLNSLWRDERIVLQRQGRERKEAAMLALRALSKEVGTALGIPMHYAVKVDFTAFESAIDALGGIDIEVPETIDDQQFPGPNYTYETFHMDAGPQHLDGATALKYARTRHTSSDFDRSSRQQQIIRAAAEKAQKAGILKKPRKILELLSILSDHLETDLTKREMVTLATIGINLSRDRVITMQLNDVNGLYGEQLYPGGLLYAPPRDLFEGASMLLPVSIPEYPVTFRQIQALSELLFRHRELYLAHPRIAVFNGGAKEGAARRLGNELIKFGFNVINVKNFPERATFKTSFIASNTAQQTSVDFFKRLFSFDEGSLRDTEDVFGDVAIILGEDYTFTHLQDLLN